MLRLIHSPIRYFRDVLKGPTRWPAACVAVTGCVALDATARIILMRRIGVPAIRAFSMTSPHANTGFTPFSFLAILAALSWPATWIAGSVLLISMDIVFDQGIAQHRRIFELTAFALYSQFPLLLGFIFAASIVRAPSLQLGASPSSREMISWAARQYAADVRGSLPITLIDTFAPCFQAWLVLLMTAGLAASLPEGFSWRRGAIYTVVLYGVLFALPAFVGGSL